MFLGTTVGTSTMAGPCANSGTSPEQVYVWTPLRSGVATLETCSATETKYDTLLYLRTAPCNTGPILTCNDDTAGCGTTTDLTNPHRGSRIMPTVTAGQTYYVVVDGYNGAKGNYRLSVTAP